MSLIAWYPLTNNTLDQIGNRHGVANGATLNANGKIGSCYYFDGVDDTINFGTGETFFPLSRMTISLWFNSDDITETTGTNPGLFGFTYGIRSQIDSNGIISFGLYKSTGTIYVYNTNGYNYHDSKWHHFAGVCDGKNIYLYLDGIYQSQGNVESFWDGYTSWPTNSWNLGRDNNNSMYYFRGKMNDLRIYDNVLSDKEIKELSKAKILHYTFDDFQEPTENLLYNNGNYTLSVSGLTVLTSSTVIEANRKFKITTTNYMDGYTFGTFRLPVPLEKLINGLTYNLSFKYKIITGTQFSLCDWCDMPVTQYTKSMGSYMFCSGYGSRSTYDSTFRFMDFYMSSNSEVEIWDIQLEQKDYATEFVNGIRDGIVRDVSGYNNNGTMSLSETPTWTKNGKLGQGSYKFNGTSQITHPNPFLNQDKLSQEWTCSAWVRLDDDTIHQLLNNFNSGNSIKYSANNTLLYLNSGLDDYYTYGGNISSLSWHHVTFVFRNSDGYRKIYCDGIDISTTGPNKTSIPAGIPSIVIVGGNLRGYLDDYRIYATVLSGEDIRELYQNRMQLDDTGNLYLNGIQEYMKLGPETPTGSSNEYENLLYIDIKKPLVLLQTTIYSYFTGSLTIRMVNTSNSQVVNTTTINVINGQQDIDLNWVVQPGTYYISRNDPTNTPLMRAIDDSNMPYEDDYMKIHTPNKYYYFWFNLKYMNPLSLDERGILSCNQISEIGITDGLIAYYPLDGNSIDYSGDKNHGTISGAIITSGLNQLSYQFDGIDDVIILDMNTINKSQYTSITVSAWIYVNSGTTQNSDWGSYIINNTSDNSIGNSIFTLGMQTSGNIVWGWDGNWASTVSSSKYNDGKWHYIVGTWNGNQSSLFIDGELNKTLAISTAKIIGTAKIAIGGNPNSTYRVFNGKIQDVRIYNRGLSLEEIKIMYDLRMGNAAMKVTPEGNVYINNEVREV